MSIQQAKAIATANNLRFDPQSAGGHYESYFLRANHPDKRQAFWIRYTLFSPKGRPQDAIGELWAIWFDGDRHTAAKEEFPVNRCELHDRHFELAIGDSRIRSNEARGKAGDFSWDLKFGSDSEPLFLLPLNMYGLPFPKAKAVVPQPLAVFNGHLTVAGKKIPIKDWTGSQNHNWGSQHTDHYAWGQVAGFDNYPDSFLEVVSARVKIGPLTTPVLSMVVLRHEGREYRINTFRDAFRSKATFGYFHWEFAFENAHVRIQGVIRARKEDFVGLNYYNPPGGNKDCLNSKIASCRVEVIEKSKVGIRHELVSRQRAAFEILTDDHSHGITVNF